MKLPLLLAQYLYQHKKLALPGIGTFQFEGQIPEEKNAPSGSILFTSGSIKAYDPELVDFIKSHTGKMRTLAEADIDSYLMDIKEFINIGKPCFLEGIGTLTKNRDGSFEFAQGTPVSARMEEVRNQVTEKPVAVHEKEYYSETPSRSTMRTLVVGIAIIAGIVLIGWGGYFFYKRYEAQNQKQELAADSGTINSNAVPIDTASAPAFDSTQTDAMFQRKDTAIADGTTTAAISSPTGIPEWKFVLRTTDKLAAEKRYQQLKSYGIPVQLQALDTFKSMVYITLAVAAADTTRVKDSLRVYYASPVTIIRK